MATLTIRFAKKVDGSVVFACLRADGSSTWQRHRRHAEFFPLHDLAHFAVETVLQLDRAFYGLLAEGWSITDFGTRPLPYEASLAEAIVGLLDGERATGRPHSVNEFSAALAVALAHSKQPLRHPVTDADLEAIREAWHALADRWSRVPVGGDMEVTFEHTAVCAV